MLTAIRLLANELRIPLVCVGTYEANQALMTDQQLADRFDASELPAGRTTSRFTNSWRVLSRVFPCGSLPNSAIQRSINGFLA